MNGASAPPPPVFDKAAEDLFELMPPSIVQQIKQAQAQQQSIQERMNRMAMLSENNAAMQNAYSNQKGMQNYNQQALQGMGVAQCVPQYGHGVLGGQNFPSLGHQLNIGQIPPHDHALNEIQAHSHALTMMNPLARNRYEDVIKLLGIKIRCVNRLDMGQTEWVLQKQIKDGRQVKFTWSVDDPGGGSFQHWKHMFDTLVDRCAELEGNDVPDTNNTADTQSAGV